MATDSSLSLEIIRPMQEPITTVYEGIIGYVPTLIAAAVILVIGYLVAWALGLLLRKILEKAHVDRHCVDRTCLRKFMGDFKLSHTLGVLLKWWVFSLFLASSATVLRLGALRDFLAKLGTVWIPAAITAFLLALAGLVVADYVARIIKDTRARYSGILADIARWVIIVLVLMTVLDTLGMQTKFVAQTLQTVLLGAVFAIALALGLAFGLGGKEEAKKAIVKAGKRKH